MILADSSAWVEYDRATNSPTDLMLTSLVRAGGSSLAVTEPVLMEVLAGARNARGHNDLRKLLTTFQWLPFDPVADFEGAARIYRACRVGGITPRGLIDCMIANVAIRTGASVLAADQGFAMIAGVVPLQLASV